MAKVRIVGTGRFKDYKAAVDVLNRVSIVAAAVDGVEVWEVFADKNTGFFVLNETFTSEKAVLELKDSMTSHGLRAAVADSIEFEQSILLSTIESERLNQSFDSMEAIRLMPIASK